MKNKKTALLLLVLCALAVIAAIAYAQEEVIFEVAPQQQAHETQDGGYGEIVIGETPAYAAPAEPEPDGGPAQAWAWVTYHDLEGRVLTSYTLREGETIGATDLAPYRDGLVFQFWYDYDAPGVPVPYAFGRAATGHLNLVPYYHLAAEVVDMAETILAGEAISQDATQQIIQSILLYGDRTEEPPAQMPDAMPEEVAHQLIEGILTIGGEAQETQQAQQAITEEATGQLIDEILHISFDGGEERHAAGSIGVMSEEQADRLILDILNMYAETDTPDAADEPAQAVADPAPDETAQAEAIPGDAQGEEPAMEDETGNQLILDILTSPDGDDAPPQETVIHETQADSAPVEDISIEDAADAGVEQPVDAPADAIADGLLLREDEAEPGQLDTPDFENAMPWVEVTYSSDGPVAPGVQVTVTATVHNVDPNLRLSYQWENNASGAFRPVPFAVGRSHTFFADDASAACEWRVTVTAQ